MKSCIVCGESFIPSKFHRNRQTCCHRDACRRERNRRIQVVYRRKREKRERQNALQVRRRRLALSPLVGLLLGALSVLFKQILHQIFPDGSAELYRFMNKVNRVIFETLEMAISSLCEVMSDGDFAAFSP